MINKKKLASGIALAATASLALAACGGSSSGSAGQGTTAKSGGTLYYLIPTSSAPEHLDPQRTYIGRDISNMQRLAYRGLLTFPVTSDIKQGATPVPDLATNLGTSTNDAKTWQFTLRDGAKWQDGKPVTCADLKYGLSRTFATDVITGGPNYALTYLDVPHDKAGQPIYNGPYKKKDQAAFDKAVVCSNNNKTITYHFLKPWSDFPLAIASLTAFDPYRQDQDKGEQSNFSVFSDGPYMLQGTFNQNTGGTFVRNPQWDKKTDPIREANPDKIVFQVGSDTDTLVQRMIKNAGNDQYAVMSSNIPPSDYASITGAVAKRATTVKSPYVFYLTPNFKQMTNPLVREALAVATNKTGWINAQGGPKAYVPATSIVNSTLTGYQPNPSFQGPATGDVAKAKALLKQAGVKTPYPIKFTYQTGTPALDKSAAALKQTWDQAGFNTTLDPQADSYYTFIQNPASNFDVAEGGWGADWPSPAAVIPPLLDGRINLTANSNGSDYGNYNSAATNKLIDAANAQATTEKAVPFWQKADAQLGKDTAYIPLGTQQFYLLHGSKVTTYLNGTGTSGFPDLGNIAVAK